MDDRQNLRYNADQRVEQFCIDHITDLTPLVEYAVEKANFDAQMLALEQAIANQGLEIIPIAADKKVDKGTLGASIIKYALRAAVKAHQLGNLPLELGLTHPLTYITDAQDQDAITRATAIKKLMKDNIGILTNLTLANITEMETEITDFTDDKNAPKQAIGIKKSTGTDQIGPLLDEVDLPKDNIGKLVHSYLSPLIIAEYDRISHVGSSTAVRHLRLIVIYTDLDTGVVLDHVKGTLNNGVETPIIKYSTKTGNLRINDATTGNYSLTSVFPGYTTDIQPTLGIDSTKLMRLEIKLKKI